MSGPEVLVECAVFEHVIGRREDRGGNGADRFLRPASSAQPYDLRVEVGGLGARSSPSALDEHGLQPRGTHAQAGRAALAGAFVVARAQAGPGAQMRGGGKPAHVGADLRQDDLGAEFADPRYRAQLLDGVTKGSQPGINLPVNRGDAGIERVDLLQMETEQEAMVSLDALVQGFAQPCLRRSDLGVRERGQLGRVGLAGDQRLDHRPAAAPHDIGQNRHQLDGGFLQGLLQALDRARLLAHQLLARAQQPPSSWISGPGTKLARISPCASSSANHVASFTSVLRPGTFLTCAALASTSSKPRPASTCQTGFQYTPVASIAAWVPP